MSVSRVRVVGVWKSYGATAVLRHASATFQAGEVVLVTGANGAGKSTLLGVIGGMIRPQKGAVELEGLGGRGPQGARQWIGWASHETLLYGDLSGEQNVQLAARAHGLDARESWERVRERFELGSFSRRPVRTYSRGQRQRVSLARALVHEPEVVLLDEPTTGLDGTGVRRLMGVVSELQRDGRVVVVVTHDTQAFERVEVTQWELAAGKLRPAEVSRETGGRPTSQEVRPTRS